MASNHGALMIGYNPVAQPRIAHLRGWAVFEAFSDAGLNVRWPVETDGTSTLKLGPGLLFMDGANIDGAEGILKVQEIQGVNRLQLVVDVHFPLLHPGEIRAFPKGGNWANADDEADKATHEFWTDPHNRDRAFALIEAADAVTTSHPRWAVGLGNFNSNVFVLPDITNVRSAKQFCYVWPRVVAAASGKRVSFMEARVRLSTWMVRKELIQHVLEAHEMDAISDE